MKIFWIKETLKIIHFNVEIIYLQKNIVNHNGISNMYCVSNKLKFKLMDSSVGLMFWLSGVYAPVFLNAF